jgi:Allophanate hydrolase C-terminal domain
VVLMFLTGDGMRGGPLHRHIEGAEFLGERRTLPRYRFYSIRDAFPALQPVGEGGHAILGELYQVPMPALHGLLTREPPELELSIVELRAGDPASSSPAPAGGAPGGAAGFSPAPAGGAPGDAAGFSPAPAGGAPGEPGAVELSFGMILRRGEDTAGRHADISGSGGWRAYRGLAQPPPAV